MYEQRRRLVTRVVTQGDMQFEVQEEEVYYVHIPDRPREQIRCALSVIRKRRSPRLSRSAEAL